jgi:hypothetical protein
MKISSLRTRIALLVAIYYLALAVGLPFLHRHGEPGPLAPTGVHQALLAHGPTGSEDTCLSCQWDKVAKAAPPTPLLWNQVERLVTRFQPARAEDPFSPSFGLPASRAPPTPSL